MLSVFSYRQEVYRKLIHLSSLWMAVVIYGVRQPLALGIFAFCIGATLVYEGARRLDTPLARLLEKALGATLRPAEKGKNFKPSGAVYVLLAAFILTLLFPPNLAAAALAMTLTGDAAAALFGRRFGTIKILNKSLQGTMAFFLTAWLTAALLVPAPAAALAALAAAVTELFSARLRLDDNLAAPLVAAAVLLLLQAF